MVLFPTKVFFTESRLNLAKLRKKSGLLESQLLLGKSMRETEDTWKHFKSKERQLECIERQLKTEELIVSTKVIYLELIIVAGLIIMPELIEFDQLLGKLPLVNLPHDAIFCERYDVLVVSQPTEPFFSQMTA